MLLGSYPFLSQLANLALYSHQACCSLSHLRSSCFKGRSIALQQNGIDKTAGSVDTQQISWLRGWPPQLLLARNFHATWAMQVFWWQHRMQSNDLNVRTEAISLQKAET